MKVVTVLGARPQFIKAAPVSRALEASGLREVLVHTGQHYDHGMSEVFFRELGIREPAYRLGVGSGPHGQQTGRMLERIEAVLEAERPDCVIVYGDTNSTLAGALAAVKLRLPVAHVEAGLRSFNRDMPEEHNRVVADHCADLLFCPTATAVSNLDAEGVRRGVHLVGDTMYDAVLAFSTLAARQSSILARCGVSAGAYALATVHRPYNTDVPEHLGSILEAFRDLPMPVVFPVHPRTRPKIGSLVGDGGGGDGQVRLVEPLGYLDMLQLTAHAGIILTDSGGLQKEAYFLGVPCVTLRPETEWVETLEGGWNVLAWADRQQIVAGATRGRPENAARSAFGDGHAAEHIVRLLMSLDCGSGQSKERRG